MIGNPYEIFQALEDIRPIDRTFQRNMQEHLDRLIKPVGSLGRMERLACQIAGIQKTIKITVDPAITLVFAGDHGVSDEGVSPYPREVSAQMLNAYQRHWAAISVLARQAACQVEVVDVGVQGSWEPWGKDNTVVSRKIRAGTRNFVKEPAMTHEECLQALQVGMDKAGQAFQDGHRSILLGEIGIGNTTVAAALACALLQESPRIMTGHGSGVDHAGWERKVYVIDQALSRHLESDLDPFEMLTRLGGFEVAAMVGAILGAARLGVVVVLDGYITGVAALLAMRMAPDTVGYLVASHQSHEPGHRRVLGALGLRPLLEWDLRLGEASGAAMSLPLLRQTCAVATEMATFSQAGVSSSDGAEHEALPYPVKEPHPFSLPERMAVYRAIESRRDIRRFLPDPLPEGVLDRLLHAAHHAPSVGYSQPWDFIIVTDSEMKQRLKKLADRERQVQSLYFEDERSALYLKLKLEGIVEAPVVLVITADMERGGAEIIGRHTMEETTLYSVACAVENVWLAARAEGVAVGWVSLFEKRHLRHVLGMPANIEPVAVLCLGFTEHYPPEPQLKTVGWAEPESLTRLIHWQRWDGSTPQSNV